MLRSSKILFQKCVEFYFIHWKVGLEIGKLCHMLHIPWTSAVMQPSFVWSQHCYASFFVGVERTSKSHEPKMSYGAYVKDFSSVPSGRAFALAMWVGKGCYLLCRSQCDCYQGLLSLLIITITYLLFLCMDPRSLMIGPLLAPHRLSITDHLVCGITGLG